MVRHTRTVGAIMAKPAFSVVEASPGVARLTVDLPKVSSEFWVLLRSDVHWDNPHCDRKLERRHLDQAKERGAAIFDFGDLFCAMQGKYDKRADKSSIRPEHTAGNYLDRLVETAADYYAPYAHLFAMIGRGNHESSIKIRHETDLTARLIERLNDRTGSKIVAGGYSGWVRFNFNRSATRRCTRNLWYTHGYGGGGPVTKDMIQSNRQQVYVENADIMVSGHVHQRWCEEAMKIRLTAEGEPERRSLWYVKCSTYKEEYGTGSGGWHVETGKGPRPLGGWWARFTPVPGKQTSSVDVEFIRTT
jgi:hypothetical protein